LDLFRKDMVLSFTFLELGQSCMSSESAWLTLVVLRSSMMEKVSVAIPTSPGLAAQPLAAIGGPTAVLKNSGMVQNRNDRWTVVGHNSSAGTSHCSS
jgi:hypothetical protein